MKKTNHTVKAAIFFTLILIGAYAPVIFLGQSYDQSNPMIPNFFGLEGKQFLFSTALDPAGVSQQNPPVSKLARDLILQGTLPLWNPYIATGHPLAADTVNYVFSPLMLGYLLPVSLWDIPLYISLWVAGFFTFLFLRKLNLNFYSSVSGGIFYMLSGMFTWFITHTIIAVLPFTPVILYCFERILSNRNPKNVILLSIAISFSVLGAHLETIIIQFLFVALYFLFRISQIIINFRNSLTSHSLISKLKIITWPIFGFMGGLGLSAFFIFPVYEFLKYGVISHFAVNYAYIKLSELNPLSYSVYFVPYLHGILHAYWSMDWALHAGNLNTGYVGVMALFFSVLCACTVLKNKNNSHKYISLFFLITGVYGIILTTRVPILDLILNLPVLNLIAWGRYGGVLVSFGFAMSAAFGIQSITSMNISKKIIGITALISLLIVLSVSLPAFSFLSDSDYPNENLKYDAMLYIAFQVLQAALLVFAAFMISIAARRDQSAILGVVLLIFLELSMYIPMGLDGVWMTLKSIVILVGMAVIIFLFLKPSKFFWNLSAPKKPKTLILCTIMVAIISSEVMISLMSPYGMLQMRDPFQNDPPLDFLKSHLGYQRSFSLDSFAANFPAAYEMSTIGLMSAFSTNSYFHFFHNFIDPQANNTNLDYPPWSYLYGPTASEEKIIKNRKYFDFLGVKYFLTDGYGLNSISPDNPSTYTYTKIGSGNDSIGQSFVSPINSIFSIGVSLGNYKLHNHGDVILILDSLPYDPKFHRETSVNAERINSTQFNNFILESPLSDIKNKTFYFSIKYPQTKDDIQKVGVYLLDKNQVGYNPRQGPIGFDNSKDFSIGYYAMKRNLDGKFYENGTFISDKELDFSLTGDTINFPLVYQYGSINIYENPTAFPRAFLVNKFITVQDNGTVNYLLSHPDFDLRNVAILEGQQLSTAQINSLNSSILDVDSGANITSFKADEVIIHTHVSGSSLLILTDTFYPGWKAFLDGKETAIYKTDGLVRSVFVPSGDHTVKFSYLPSSFVIGLGITLITLVILISFLLLYQRKEKSKIS